MSRKRRTEIKDRKKAKPARARLRWLPLAIFFCALFMRLIYLAEDSSSPFFTYRGLDALDYHNEALSIVDGTWPANKTFERPPLYPIFLGLLYKTVGNGYGVLKFVQAVIGSLSCVLVYLIARIIFAERFVAVAAALICCLCGTMIYFDSRLLSVNLDVLLQMLAIWTLVLAAKRVHFGWWVLAGICIGLSAINRGGILLFLPLVLVWMFMVTRRGWRVGVNVDNAGTTKRAYWVPAMALLVPVVLLISPVSWHNVKYDIPRGLPLPPDAGQQPFPEVLKQFVSGGFLRLGGVVGYNFYLGNCWELREINLVNHAEHFVETPQIWKEPLDHGVQTASGHSGYLMSKALRNIAEEPLNYFKLMGLKFLQLLNGTEMPRNSNPYAYRQHSILLSMLLWKKLVAFPSGLLIPLGLVGIFLERRRWREHFLLLGCLFMQCLFILAFFVTARYRVPSLPFLAIYAAFAVKYFGHHVRQQTYGKAAGSLLLLIGLLILCNIPIVKVHSEHGHYEHINLGGALAEQGQLEKAIVHFREGQRLNPSYVDAYVNLGIALKKLGKIDEAAAQLEDALRLDPESGKAHHNLGYILAQQGRYEEAITSYNAALAIKPDNAEAHIDKGVALQMQGKLNEAIRSYQTALTFKPDYATAYNNIGLARVKQGKLDEAITAYREALRIDPHDVSALMNLGRGLRRQGKVGQAITQFREALQIDPQNAEAHFNLAYDLTRVGQYDEAISEYHQVLQLQPMNVDVRYNLGLIMQRQGRLPEAISEYRKVLQINPSYAKARKALEDALADQK